MDGPKVKRPRLRSGVDLKQAYKGRPVYVVRERWVDYFPTGCGLRYRLVGGYPAYKGEFPPDEILEMV